MFDTVECPYCEHENDMSDGLTDLPSDNRFDHECGSCEREFEVLVEFEPSYCASEINYVSCEKCGKETRDINSKGRVFPFPNSIKETEICGDCFMEGHRIDYARKEVLEKMEVKSE